MLITAEEYYGMGFSCDDEELLESCLKRAEYTLVGLTEGRVMDALAAGGTAAECVRQAAGFQTAKLVEQEEYIAGNAASAVERVSVGDFSYSVGAVQPQQAEDTVYDLSIQTVRLLRAAGCLYGGRVAL